MLIEQQFRGLDTDLPHWSEYLHHVGLQTSQAELFGFTHPRLEETGSGYQVIQPGTLTHPELRLHIQPQNENTLLTLEVKNTTNRPISAERLIVLAEDLHSLTPDPSAIWLFQMGNQGWSQAGLQKLDHPNEPAPLKSPRFPYPNENSIYPSVTCALTDHGAKLWGFTSALHQAGIIDIHRETKILTAASYTEGKMLEPGQKVASEELMILWDTGLDPALKKYDMRLAKVMKATPDDSKDVYFCTWYQAGDEVNERYVRDNLEYIIANRQRLPVTGILLDDGPFPVAQWLEPDPEKFPHGLEPLIQDIHQADLKFGLWIAPFMVPQSSSLYLQHPEWVVKDESRLPIVAKHWKGQPHFALDTTHPQAQEWLKQQIKGMVDLDIDLLKVDFAYAAAIRGVRHDTQATSIEAYRQGMHIIAQELAKAKDRHIIMLGCGAPLPPSVGICESMRLATDTILGWPPRGKEKFNDDGTPSGEYYTLLSLLSRGFLSTCFNPDADALMLRENGSQLSLPEIYTQAILYWLHQQQLTIGDDLTRLEKDRQEIYAWLYPPLKQGLEIARFDIQGRPDAMWYQSPGKKEKLMVLVNWDHHPQVVEGLPLEAAAHGLDTITGSYEGIINPGDIYATEIPAHGTKVIKLTPVLPHPQVIGTNLHIAGGMAEIKEYHWDQNNLQLSLTLSSPGTHTGSIAIAFPQEFEPLSLPSQKGILFHSLTLNHNEDVTLQFSFTPKETAPSLPAQLIPNPA